jgi:hypothetical protein
MFNGTVLLSDITEHGRISNTTNWIAQGSFPQDFVLRSLLVTEQGVRETACLLGVKAMEASKNVIESYSRAGLEDASMPLVA